jgi:hypothetical protein
MRCTAAATRATTVIASLMKQLQAEVDLLLDLDMARKDIAEAMKKCDTPAESDMLYAEAKGVVNTQARTIGHAARALVSVDKKNIAQIGHSSKQIAAALPLLIEASKAAASNTDDKQVQTELMKQTRELGKACETIVASAKACAIDAGDKPALTKMTNSTKMATEAIAQLLAAAKKGDMAAFACDEALSKLARNVGAFDAALLYASAGQLQEEKSGDGNFSKAQQALAQASQGMLADAKQLGNAATKGTPAQLGEAAKKAADRSDVMVATAKSTAALIDNLDTQQSLLQGGKAVLAAATRVVEAALVVQQSPGDAAAVSEARKCDAELGAAVEALASSTAAAAEEQSRGARDLDAASQAVERSLKGFDEHGNNKASAEEVVQACRAVANSTGALVSACNMSDPAAMSAAAQQITDASVSLLENGKGAQRLTDKQIIKTALADSSKGTAKAILTMLAAARALTSSKITPDTMSKLSAATQAVATQVHQVVEAAKQLPGAAHLRLEEEGDDLEDLGERVDVSCASSCLSHACRSRAGAEEGGAGDRGRHRAAAQPDQAEGGQAAGHGRDRHRRADHRLGRRDHVGVRRAGHRRRRRAEGARRVEEGGQIDVVSDA